MLIRSPLKLQEFANTLNLLIMSTITNIEKKDSVTQPKWLTLLRVAVGLILFWKGISFIQDSSRVEAMVQSTGINIFDENAQTVSFIISYLNLLGGFFIAVGLFTRWASLVQIPILIGAIVFVNLKAGLSLSNSELMLSILVLILLIVFVIKGSGVLSADEYFRNYYKAGYEQGHTKEFLE